MHCGVLIADSTVNIFLFISGTPTQKKNPQECTLSLVEKKKPAESEREERDRG